MNIWAMGDRDGMASHYYSKALLLLAKHLHGDNSTNGSNVLPAAFFWLRKSRDLGHNEAMDQLKEWESCDEKVDVQTAERKCRLARNSSNAPSARPSGIAARNA
ncbi:hypothetical protein THAOC_14095, partial [Thalassiosira oceanica]